jgi:hypothetical protein
MKRLLFIFFICAAYLSAKAQTPTHIINFPGSKYVFVGSLTMENSSSANSQKLIIKILGGSWFEDSNGETTYYISNRDGLNIRQVSFGGSNNNLIPLKAYQNGHNIDFYIVPDVGNYTSFAVTSFSYGYTLTPQYVTITEQTTIPPGTDITSTAPIKTVTATDGGGNIGIGTNTPTNTLTLRRVAYGTSNDVGIDFSATNGEYSPVYARIALGIGTASQNQGTGYLSFSTLNSGTLIEGMRIDPTGNIGIGTSNPGGYKLAVNGKIRAHEIKVEAAPWPDYVFAKDYSLPSLIETEKHIRENGHLLGIPSAAEVKANGIDLGDMNAKLLQKIEELTLHLIEQNKLIETYSKQVISQNDRIIKLEVANNKSN